jgi:CspA family cold shock protein
MASTSSVSQSTVTSSDRFIGRVKWFNNKAGYGFITVTDGPKAGSDIFVHHSSIKVDAQQYKYLVQGEYVEFALSAVSSGDHEFQASDVSGIKGGKIMCETRHELVATRSSYKSHAQDKTQSQVQTPVEKASDDAKPWTPARKPRQQAAPSPAQDQTQTPPPAKVAKSTGGRGAGRGQSTAGRGSTGGRGGRGRGKSTA